MFLKLLLFFSSLICFDKLDFFGNNKLHIFVRVSLEPFESTRCSQECKTKQSNKLNQPVNFLLFEITYPISARFSIFVVLKTSENRFKAYKNRKLGWIGLIWQQQSCCLDSFFLVTFGSCPFFVEVGN